MMKTITICFLFLLFSSLACPSLIAQTTQASISGKVMNSDQKALSADEPVSKLTATSGSNKLYTVLLLGAFAGGIIWWGKQKDNR